jgi:LmbE family N-acetylglucosaminyl deacetylase
MSVRLSDDDDPEALWREIALLPALASVRLEGTRKIVVVSPHPDDETLGVGGTLHQLARQGHAIELVAVTEGEHSHPRSTTHSPRQLAERRARERRLALQKLGLHDANCTRLGIPDGRVAAAQDLAARLREFLQGAALCIAPYRADGHPDHDATGRAAAHAAAASGVALWEYPVWAWQWSVADRDELPWRNARRVPLDRAAQRAKAEAIQAYQSQIAPLSSAPGDECVLSRALLAHFSRDFEVLFT